MAQLPTHNAEVQLVGPHGVCKVEVSLTFSIPPEQFSPGMTVIAVDEIQRAIVRIVNNARKPR